HIAPGTPQRCRLQLSPPGPDSGPEDENTSAPHRPHRPLATATSPRWPTSTAAQLGHRSPAWQVRRSASQFLSDLPRNTSPTRPTPPPPARGPGAPPGVPQPPPRSTSHNPPPMKSRTSAKYGHQNQALGSG